MSLPSTRGSRVNSSLRKMAQMTRVQMFKRDKVIAVMGPTGAGKSSFLQNVAPHLCERFPAGHTLVSETSQIQSASFTKNGTKIELVDTPGFDDSQSSRTDLEILQMIAAFLKKQWYQRSSVLVGLVYVHRISDTRAGRISQRNLRMFRKLCGDDSMKNVVILTTMWDNVTLEEGEKREKELKLGYNAFKPLLDNGARMMRHNRTQESADEVINYLLGKGAIATQMGRELAEENKSMEDTAAGAELGRQIQEILKEHKEKVEETRLTAQCDFAEEKPKVDVELIELLMELDELRWKSVQVNDPPPHQSTSANLPAPERRCIEHYSRLLGLVTKYKPTLAEYPRIAKSAASCAIDFANAMKMSLEVAQHTSSALRSTLETGDMRSFQEFVVGLNSHPKTFTQGIWTKALDDIKTVTDDIETVLAKDSEKPRMMSKVFNGHTAQRCRALNEILGSMRDVVTDMRSMVDWWISVIRTIRCVEGTALQENGGVGVDTSAIASVINALNAYYEAYAQCSQVLRDAANGILY